jgi:mono/diheme cytochrome c family protein
LSPFIGEAAIGMAGLRCRSRIPGFHSRREEHRMRASLLLLPALALSLAACKQPAATDTKASTDAPASSATAASATTAAAHGMSDAELIAQGEYIARIGGCNDCHTPGYPQSGGKVPKAQWLVGTPVGWMGPWGTTYPINIRLKAADMDDAAWLDYTSKLHTRPPMPDFAVRDMKESDRLALLRFVKSLGPAGEPAPAYLEPGKQPPMPYVEFKLPPPPAAASTAAKPASAG